MGTPTRYLEASLDLLAGRGPAPPGGRWPGDAVAGVYVGPRARVEGTLGPGAIVLAGASVATSAHVERAIVWPSEDVPPGHAVTDGIWFDGALRR